MQVKDMCVLIVSFFQLFQMFENVHNTRLEENKDT